MGLSLTRWRYSDPAIKQFILHKDTERQASGQKRFVIKDLDETHVFIEASALGFVQESLDQLMDVNAFDRPDLRQ